ncbi:MAG: nicotinate (nicotinamide) nucleotide adenylyltransferase [Endomicrobiaceae bacterium]|nr:nicotinate (nicotinamide) nucleotide adenylyltransferase [Endomicrobiaceae bacterium]
MSKIGVLGGSFDPIHNAHIEVAQKAVFEFELDFVIFVPAYLPPHKQKLEVSDVHRLNMVSLGIENNHKFLLDTFEIESKKIIYSFQTLDYLQKKYFKDKIKLIVGSDTFNQLDTWKKPEYIAKKYGFFVMQRPNVVTDINSKYYKYACLSKTLMKDIASTQIRTMIKNNENVDDFIPKKVLEYIKDNNLYGK